MVCRFNQTLVWESHRPSTKVAEQYSSQGCYLSGFLGFRTGLARREPVGFARGDAAGRRFGAVLRWMISRMRSSPWSICAAASAIPRSVQLMTSASNSQPFRMRLVYEPSFSSIPRSFKNPLMCSNNSFFLIVFIDFSAAVSDSPRGGLKPSGRSIPATETTSANSSSV